MFFTRHLKKILFKYSFIVGVFTITAKPQIFNGSVWLKNYSNVFFQIQVIATFIKKFRNTKLNMPFPFIFFEDYMKYKKMKHL